MSACQILEVKSVVVETGDGPAAAMLISIDTGSDFGDDFVATVVERFKLERMTAPPDTALLCVTAIGPVGADEFVAAWNRVAAADPIVDVFMSMMKVADVVQGSEAGHELSRASLRPGA